MIYTAENPGEWHQWKQKTANKNLPLNEAKRKYLKEQLLFEDQYTNFALTQQAIQQQRAQTGGTSLNGIKSVAFDASPVFQTNTGNTQTLKVIFAKPVLVTGSPLVEVANNQFGGGSAATFNYTYSAGSSTNELTFQHIHPTAAVTSQGFSANIVAIGSNLAPIGTIVQPTNAINDIYELTDTDYTTSGDGNGLSLQVEIDGNQITSVICTTNGNDFIPGEVISFANGSLGGTSVGGSITVATSALRADTVSFAAGSTVTLNSGTITTGDGSFNTQYNDINRRQGTPALDFNSTSTKTGVAS
tara:strand:- start:9 stop:914 length:906 start_codon:yes stop_codon:yes gene_type:complete